MTAFLPDHLSSTDLAVGVDRRTQREIVRAQSAGLALTARERAKVDAVADVGESALIATAHLSAVEALLVSRTPHAEARLQHIADAATAGIGDVVLGMRRYCR